MIFAKEYHIEFLACLYLILFSGCSLFSLRRRLEEERQRQLAEEAKQREAAEKKRQAELLEQQRRKEEELRRQREEQRQREGVWIAHVHVYV